MPPELTVVLPTYNEIENLVRAVAGIRQSGAAVLIVDDNSPDGTGELADRLAAGDDAVTVMHRRTKTGLGDAYAAGFAAALQGTASLIGQMDADGSHDPMDLPRLCEVVVDGGADVAIGSRYVPGGSTAGWSWFRRMLSSTANHYVRLMLGVPTHDSTAGFRIYRADALRRLDPATCRSANYAFQVEMTYRAVGAGLRIVEVPIRFIERSEGDSKMSIGIALETVLLITLWGVRRLWRRLRSGPDASLRSSR